MRKRSLVVGLLAGAATALATVALGPSALAQDDPGVSPMIVGGGDADQTYSFMVSLQDGGNHFCGGSLIGSEWVLTAAHCVEGSAPGGVSMRIGSNEYQSGGEEAQAAEIVVHPDYGSGAGNDIALVRTTAPVASAPVSLAGDAPVGTASRLLGWGQTCPRPGGCGAPDFLQQLDVEVLDAGECTGIDGSLELCTSNPGGDSGACYGDSGGPQLTGTTGSWSLIGVTSRSGNGDSTCATGPSIYTDATAYADWIAQTTGS